MWNLWTAYGVSLTISFTVHYRRLPFGCRTLLWCFSHSIDTKRNGSNGSFPAGTMTMVQYFTVCVSCLCLCMTSSNLGHKKKNRTMRALYRRAFSTTSAKSLRGKVALVTGAGTGIGQESSLALAGAGASLVLAGRRRDPLAETADLITKQGGAMPLIVPTDLTDPSAISGLFAAIESQHGRLDILFNNAGTGAPAVPIDELPLEKWQLSVDTNLTAMFICTQHAFRIMKRQTPMGGRIINNGSVSADRPRPNSAPYTATKHAVTVRTLTGPFLPDAMILRGRAFDLVCGRV